MKFLRCTTPTILDIREIITLGMTTKANTNKIGHKGSGLKFALAYIHRLGSYLEAKTTSYHIKSEIREEEVHGICHKFIILKDTQNNKITEANITTHAGEDTWADPWLIIRELLQNVIDEGGQYEITENAEMEKVEGTITQVMLTKELEEALEKKETWMQPRFKTIINKGHTDIKGLYFNGFLVHQSKKPWKFSYDVTDILKRTQLSEDRQIKNGDLYEIFNEIAKHTKFNEFGNEIYDSAFQKDLEEDIELLYSGVYNIINDNFTAWGGTEGFDIQNLTKAFKLRHGEHAAFHSDPVGTEDTVVYYARAAGFTPAQVSYKISRILHYNHQLTPLQKCLPTIEKRIERVKNIEASHKSKLKMAQILVKKLKPPGVRIQIVKKIVATDNLACWALADATHNRVKVLEDLLDQDIPTIAKALIEEYAHIRTGADDNSNPMQRGLIEMLYETVTNNLRNKTRNYILGQELQNK